MYISILQFATSHYMLKKYVREYLLKIATKKYFIVMLRKNSKLIESENDLQYSIERILVMKPKIPKPNGCKVIMYML